MKLLQIERSRTLLGEFWFSAISHDNGKKDGKRLKQKRNDDLITMAFILF